MSVYPPSEFTHHQYFMSSPNIGEGCRGGSSGGRLPDRSQVFYAGIGADEAEITEQRGTYVIVEMLDPPTREKTPRGNGKVVLDFNL